MVWSLMVAIASQALPMTSLLGFGAPHYQEGKVNKIAGLVPANETLAKCYYVQDWSWRMRRRTPIYCMPKSPLMHKAEPLFGSTERHPDETEGVPALGFYLWSWAVSASDCCVASWDGQARNQGRWGCYYRTSKSVP